MASSEETLRSPATCRPSRSVITRSSGESIPLFMHVGVVRMRPSPRRTERLPSQATIKLRSYIQRPATHISRACWASLFAWPGKSESGVKVGLLPGAEISRTVSFKSLQAHPVGTYEMAPPAPCLACAQRTYYKSRRESSALLPFFAWPGHAWRFSGADPARQAEQSSKALGVNPAQLERRGYAVDRQHVSRDTVIDLVQFCVAHHFVEGILHDVHQALVDLALPPEESLAVLHPLEITHGHAAGVAQNVGYREDPFRINDRIGLPGGRAVRAFTEDFRLHLVCISLGDLVLNGGGDGDVARLEEYVPRGHFRSAVGKTLQLLFLRVNPVDHFGYVESLLVVQPAADIRETDDFVAGFLHEVGGHRADISETLHHHAASLSFDADLGERLVTADHHSASRGFASPPGTAELNRLPGYHRRGGLPDVHRIGVHHPSHGLFAGAHVRCGNVALRSQPIRQFRGVASRQAFHFSAR